LARRREAAKLMLLCTYRPVDVVLSNSSLKGLKQDLQVHRLCSEIALERLEEPLIAEYLATEFSEGNLPAGLATVIYRHSGGNALFMVAIVQDMLKRGLIARDNDGGWSLTTPLETIAPSVPETLQQMLEAAPRISRTPRFLAPILRFCLLVPGTAALTFFPRGCVCQLEIVRHRN
jgi:predicted ATPase